MGLFGGIIDIFKLIYEEGEKEWLDETKYKESLNELYFQIENGEITEEEYERKEAEILEQLRAIQKYKKEHGYTEGN
jgi:hypothetical protein